MRLLPCLDVPTGHAFLSYVHENSVQVDGLHAQLQTAKVDVWRDRDKLWGGDDWKRQIRVAIEQDALAFIACFSQLAVSKYKTVQREELLFAIEEGKKLAPGARWIIPVRFDECEVPDYDLGGGRTLRALHRVDLFGSDHATNLDRLIRAVTEHIGPTTDLPASARACWDRPYARSIRPGTADIDEFVDFAADRLQVTVSLDLAIDAIGDVEPSIFETDGRQVVMVPNATEGCFTPCGAEILLHDLDATTDAAFYFEHGRHIIRGRFLVRGVSGPHQGVNSVSLRALPGA